MARESNQNRHDIYQLQFTVPPKTTNPPPIVKSNLAPYVLKKWPLPEGPLGGVGPLGDSLAPTGYLLGDPLGDPVWGPW